MKSMKMAGLVALLASTLSGCVVDPGLMGSVSVGTRAQPQPQAQERRRDEHHDNGRHEGERKRHHGEDDD